MVNKKIRTWCVRSEVWCALYGVHSVHGVRRVCKQAFDQTLLQPFT